MLLLMTAGSKLNVTDDLKKLINRLPKMAKHSSHHDLNSHAQSQETAKSRERG
jgi:hypothetical protein